MHRIKWRGADPSANLVAVESENGRRAATQRAFEPEIPGERPWGLARAGDIGRVTTGDTYWVFGYGSLIWRPGFADIGQEKARLFGAHRRLCVRSFRHRGTAERPGLVFGLMPGGSCLGMGFAVSAASWDETRDYLRERERDNGVYREVMRPIGLADGREVMALAFVVERGHPQFAGRLSLCEQVEIVAGAVGESGPNPDYVRETARHLSAMGVHDRALIALISALDAQQL